jgi:integrase
LCCRLSASDKGGFTDPSRQPFGSYLAEWLEGLRLAPSKVASYRRNIRLHIAPGIGTVPLAQVTPLRLDALYRKLEKSGRQDGRGDGLSARTVLYIHTIVSAALRDAVKADLLARNPAAKAHPPTARQAAAPEMHPWTAAQLAAFLAWAREHSELFAAWFMLAMTGMRRGELLALRWRDIDLDAGTIRVRRSVGVVKTFGEPEEIDEGPTKTNTPRVIDLAPRTVAVLRAWKRERGAMALQLARDDALAFGNVEGIHRHPETFSKLFVKAVARCRRDLGEDAMPAIRLHDLRHTCATILLSAGEPVTTVSRMLGHKSVNITLGTYSHVLPGDVKRAVARLDELTGEA